MDVHLKHKALMKKLKKQVRLLERKEERTRNKLHAALKKIRKLGVTYKSKLETKLRAMHKKVSADMEAKLLKTVDVKMRSVENAVANVRHEIKAKVKGHIAKTKKQGNGGGKK